MVMIDMEMPKNCYECDFFDGEYGPEYPEKCYCGVTGLGRDRKDCVKRPKDCPLKEAEQPEVTG